MPRVSEEQKFVDYLKQYRIPLSAINFSESTSQFTEEQQKRITEIYYGIPASGVKADAAIAPVSRNAATAPTPPLFIHPSRTPVPTATEDSTPPSTNNSHEKKEYIEFEAFKVGASSPAQTPANSNIETVDSFSFENKKEGPARIGYRPVELPREDIRIRKKKWIFF